MSNTDSTRRALIKGHDRERIAAYLPSNYRVIRIYNSRLHGPVTLIEGEDAAGWTLDGYVLPRLASGLLFGSETLEERIS